MAEKIIKEFKKVLQRQEILEDPVAAASKNNIEQKFFNLWWPEILMYCSNLNLYDQALFEGYRKFIEHNRGALIKTLPIKVLLALFWSYKRLNLDYPNLYGVILERSLEREKEFEFLNTLRLVWMLSINHEQYNERNLNYLVRKMINGIKGKSYYAHNAKNAVQIIQICYSLFPELIDSYKFNPETGKFEEKIFSESEFQEVLAKNKNPFIANSKELFQLYKTSKYVVKQNMEDRIIFDNKKKNLTYLESNDKDTHFYILKNKFSQSSTFEQQVFETMNAIPDLKFYRNVILGIYELDAVIVPDTVLEINGHFHYIKERNDYIINHHIKAR